MELIRLSDSKDDEKISWPFEELDMRRLWLWCDSVPDLEAAPAVDCAGEGSCSIRPMAYMAVLGTLESFDGGGAEAPVIRGNGKLWVLPTEFPGVSVLSLPSGVGTVWMAMENSLVMRTVFLSLALLLLLLLLLPAAAAAAFAVLAALVPGGGLFGV
jgi:hypothetical protein